MTKNKYKNIIWDWNGTLLNDITICIDSMNILLEERDLPRLSVEQYRNVFTFPVKHYYELIGFDFTTEDFNVPAHKFIDNYQKNLSKASLFQDTETVLKLFSDKNYNQFILSAMEQNSLRTSVNDMKITNYFTKIVGINNHLAHSKIGIGLELINDLGLIKSETLMIGDTLHDIEVANSMGINCVLISNGHQSEKILKINGHKVFNSIIDILSIEDIQ